MDDDDDVGNFYSEYMVTFTWIMHEDTIGITLIPREAIGTVRTIR